MTRSERYLVILSPSNNSVNRPKRQAKNEVGHSGLMTWFIEESFYSINNHYENSAKKRVVSDSINEIL